MAERARKKVPEPFPGAYYLAGAITIALMLLFLALGASLPPSSSTAAAGACQIGRYMT